MTLRDVYRRESLEPENTNGIGIHNVRQRLQLTYQGAQEFVIASSPNEGTRVEMSLPILEEARAPAAHS